MMNKTITNQICNYCGTENTQKDSGWVRSFGVFAGAPNPTTLPPQPLPGQPGKLAPLANGVQRVPLIDLCAGCQSKVTIADLLAMSAAPTTVLHPPVLAPVENPAT